MTRNQLKDVLLSDGRWSDEVYILAPDGSKILYRIAAAYFPDDHPSVPKDSIVLIPMLAPAF